MTKIIGLTGGIGSGKTTIANYFRAKGVPVYIADDAAREITNTLEIKNAIKTEFGSTVFDGEILNRQKLADVVFSNPEKLIALNAIIHPAVRNHFKEWISNYENVPYIIYETAILFESGNYKNCDQIITITAPIELRIDRVMKRDKTTKEAVLKRMDSQWTDAQRISKSDFTIENITLKTTKQEFEKILKILNI